MVKNIINSIEIKYILAISIEFMNILNLNPSKLLVIFIICFKKLKLMCIEKRSIINID